MVPDPLEVITGCRFAPRCSYAMDICHKKVPPLQIFADGYSLHCHLQKEVEN
jgi:oligopeptide/dipeptide ABC transporter, ATP-binding protein, C-terminal domain